MKRFLRSETSDAVIKIWREFQQVYKVVINWAPEQDPKHFFNHAKDWINCFLSLNGKREGYERSRITPYMHLMVAHTSGVLSLQIC